MQWRKSIWEVSFSHLFMKFTSSAPVRVLNVDGFPIFGASNCAKSTTRKSVERALFGTTHFWPLMTVQLVNYPQMTHGALYGFTLLGTKMGPRVSVDCCCCCCCWWQLSNGSKFVVKFWNWYFYLFLCWGEFQLQETESLVLRRKCSSTFFYFGEQ